MIRFDQIAQWIDQLSAGDDPSMATINRKNVRVELDGELRRRWEEMLLSRKISQTDAIIALMQLAVRIEDPELQAMLLGQLPATTDRVGRMLRAVETDPGERSIRIADARASAPRESASRPEKPPRR